MVGLFQARFSNWCFLPSTKWWAKIWWAVWYPSACWSDPLILSVIPGATPLWAHAYCTYSATLATACLDFLASVLSVSVWKLIREFQSTLSFTVSFSFSINVHISRSATVPYQENSRQNHIADELHWFGANDCITGSDKIRQIRILPKVYSISVCIIRKSS